MAATIAPTSEGRSEGASLKATARREGISWSKEYAARTTEATWAALALKGSSPQSTVRAAEATSGLMLLRAGGGPEKRGARRRDWPLREVEAALKAAPAIDLAAFTRSAGEKLGFGAGAETGEKTEEGWEGPLEATGG